MGTRIITQPDGLFARFSEIVDHFTHTDMTHAEAVQCCVDEGLSNPEAIAKVARGSANPGRWNEAVAIIEAAHGEFVLS
jgi:hypothetical protein